LNIHQFSSLVEVQAIIEAWRMDYKHYRPHSSLGHLIPMSLSHNVRLNRPPKKPPLLWSKIASKGDQHQEYLRHRMPLKAYAVDDIFVL